MLCNFVTPFLKNIIRKLRVKSVEVTKFLKSCKERKSNIKIQMSTASIERQPRHVLPVYFTYICISHSTFSLTYYFTSIRTKRAQENIATTRRNDVCTRHYIHMYIHIYTSIDRGIRLHAFMR